MIDAGKFTTQEKTQEDIFKKKIEAKLFTANPMRWADLQERAAINTDWNWYYPSALKDAKDQYVANGFGQKMAICWIKIPRYQRLVLL